MVGMPALPNEKVDEPGFLKVKSTQPEDRRYSGRITVCLVIYQYGLYGERLEEVECLK